MIMYLDGWLLKFMYSHLTYLKWLNGLWSGWNYRYRQLQNNGLNDRVSMAMPVAPLRLELVETINRWIL